MFIPASALLAMRSIYIGQLLRSAAAPFIVRMHVRLGGVAMACDYPHPANVPTSNLHLEQDSDNFVFFNLKDAS